MEPPELGRVGEDRLGPSAPDGKTVTPPGPPVLHWDDYLESLAQHASAGAIRALELREACQGPHAGSYASMPAAAAAVAARAFARLVPMLREAKRKP